MNSVKAEEDVPVEFMMDFDAVNYIDDGSHIVTKIEFTDNVWSCVFGTEPAENAPPCYLAIRIGTKMVRFSAVHDDDIKVVREPLPENSQLRYSVMVNDEPVEFDCGEEFPRLH